MLQHAVVSFTCAAAMSAASTAAAESDDKTIAELRATVANLQTQVDQLKSQNDENWLTDQRAAEIRGLVQDVLADADTRASLLQDGAVAGYDKNFFIGDAAGNFLLKVAGQMQFRFVYNNQDEAGGDSNRYGFENRRTKLRFFGHVVDPSWQYLVLGAFDRDGGAFVLDEAFITKDLENGLKIRAGQFKAPFMREELVSSTRQQAVERSLVNEEFNQDRVQGVELAWEGDNARAAAAVSDGFFPGGVGTDNTGWQMEDTEFALTGRAELMLMGDDWKRFDDFSSWREDEGTAIMLGGAIHYQKDESGTAGPNPFTGTADEVEFLGLTADVSAEFGGINAFAAVTYRDLENDLPGSDLSQLGFVLQGGFFFTEDLEGFARYEWADADIAGIEDLSVITIGVNKYFAKHNLKWQNDVGFGLDEVAGIWSTSSAGWRTDPADDDGQVVIRSQMQLLF
jgi:hypothetical protein